MKKLYLIAIVAVIFFACSNGNGPERVYEKTPEPKLLDTTKILKPKG